MKEGVRGITETEENWEFLIKVIKNGTKIDWKGIKNRLNHTKETVQMEVKLSETKWLDLSGNMILVKLTQKIRAQ